MSGPNDRALRARAQKVIPNGMYGHQSAFFMPEGTPQFFAKADGAYLWDYDGNRYIDYICAYGPNLFGYANKEIDTAYKEQLDQIDLGTGPTALMVELAETFCAQVAHADWIVTCKNGTDATTIGLMTARAHRGKRKILVAEGAYHGATTWCTPMPAGTLEEDRQHIIYYQYNDAQSLKAAAEQAGDDLAGIFASPFKHDMAADQELPDPAYAKCARQICDEKDALLIIDEVRAGFRIAKECSWTTIGVEPDVSSWGKAIANGHPISCLVGSNRARAAVEKLYVTGSYWFAAAAMAASLKTFELIRTTDYLEKTVLLGDRLRDGLTDVAGKHDFDMRQTGPSQMPMVLFNDDQGVHDGELGNAFVAGMMSRGIYIHPYHNLFINAAMSQADIDFTIESADEVLASILRQKAA